VKLKTRQRDEPDINLTSLIDVVLLLLIFFMVSTSFVREAEINLRLPEASASAPTDAPADALEITVTEAGSYLVNGRALGKGPRLRVTPTAGSIEVFVVIGGKMQKKTISYPETREITFK